MNLYILNDIEYFTIILTNISFILPCLFFCKRLYVITNNYLSFKIFHRFLLYLRIYICQFLATILMIFNSVNYHIHEGNEQLRIVDYNSVSLCVSLNFNYLVCDDLYLKNVLDLYLVILKIVGYLFNKTNQYEFIEIPMMLFIIIVTKRKHIIDINFKLVVLTILSLLVFFISSITEFNRINIINTKIIYIISHSLWHILIGITYYIALRQIQHYNNTDLLNIEHIYINKYVRVNNQQTFFEI